MARLQLGVDITVDGARELGRVARTLDGTGDELDDLAVHLDRAADKARELSDQVDNAAGNLRFDQASASAQRFEDSGEGLRNMVNGISDSFSAATDESKSFGERVALGAGGVADMASGMRNFAIPALQSLTSGALTSGLAVVTSVGQQVAAWALLGVQSLLHAAKVAAAWVIAMGPIGILVAAIVAAVALIILNWDNIVSFLSGVFTNIGKMLENLAKTFTDIWDGILSFLGDVMDSIGDIGRDIWKPIGEGFKAAIGVVKGIWNAFVGFWNGIQISVPSVDIPFVGRVGGFNFGLPDLPRLAEGGIVTRPTLALIGEKGPEAVVPLGQSMGAVHYHTHLTVEGNLQARNVQEAEDALLRVSRFSAVGSA